MADKRKIIMDVDTGTDDAVALTMAMLSPEFELLGICSVNGNLEVKLTTNNSLRVVEACGKQGQVKVYKGADLPMASTLLKNSWHDLYRKNPRREGTLDSKVEVHTDYLPTPDPVITEEAESAVAFYLRTLMAAEDHSITIVAVGPLTNVALAMRADPRIIDKIDEIYIMGGACEDMNVTPAAELNFWVDPEAAEVVLQSGCKMTLVPLDATDKACITAEEVEMFRSIGTRPAKLIADLISQRITGYSKTYLDIQGKAPIHDALAVCAILHPEVLEDVIETWVHVDINRGWAYGQSIVDRRARVSPEEANCRFAMGANRELFRDWMLGVLRSAAK